MRCLKSYLHGLIAFVCLSQTVSAQNMRETGLILLDESTYRSIPLASTPLFGDLPDAVDLSSTFPVPGDQGQQASCVGWAVAYSLKSYHERNERDWSLSDDSHLFSPAFIYNQIKQSQDCNGGSSYVDALNILRRDGSAPLSDFSYDESTCSAVPDARVKQVARAFAVADWRRVNVQDETEIKTQVASGFPVLIGMIVDEAFSRMEGDVIYDSPDGVSPGGHAMVVVGYDDSRAAFKVINSWGTDWGDGGFGHIAYKTFRQTVREGYVVQDIVAARPVPDETVDPPEVVDDESVGPLPSPSINVGTPAIFHNIQVPVGNGFGSAPGMRIGLSGLIASAEGKQIQIVVKFGYFNGPPLYANPQEQQYRDIGGLVATGTPPIPISSQSESLEGIELSIPYYALNFPPTNGMNLLSLSLTVIAYIDNQQIAQSVPVPFQLRW